MADFDSVAAAQPQRPHLPAGWQPNLQRMLSDIVPMLSAELRHAFREFVKSLKAKRDGKLEQVDGCFACCPYIAGPSIYSNKTPALPSLHECDGYFLDISDNVAAKSHLMSRDRTLTVNRSVGSNASWS